MSATNATRTRKKCFVIICDEPALPNDKFCTKHHREADRWLRDEKWLDQQDRIREQRMVSENWWGDVGDRRHRVDTSTVQDLFDDREELALEEWDDEWGDDWDDDEEAA